MDKDIHVWTMKHHARKLINEQEREKNAPIIGYTHRTMRNVVPLVLRDKKEKILDKLGKGKTKKRKLKHKKLKKRKSKKRRHTKRTTSTKRKNYKKTKKH